MTESKKNIYNNVKCFYRGGIINERKINIKGCRKQLLDTYKVNKRNNVNSVSCDNSSFINISRDNNSISV